MLGRSHLETLTSAELIAIADDLGIDIPEDLNRRFIIGELLEVAEDMNRSPMVDLAVDTSGELKPATVLPKSYNETQISVVLRNPAWAFVYWDVKESDLADLQENSDFVNLNLRLSFFTEESDSKPSDSFEIPVDISDREQYVLLPAGKNYVRVDLIAEFKNDSQKILACSRRIQVPFMARELANPLHEISFSPVMELSGLPALLRTHFMNHRQSFM